MVVKNTPPAYGGGDGPEDIRLASGVSPLAPGVAPFRVEDPPELPSPTENGGIGGKGKK